jgi:hypothetical protein
MSNLLFDVRDVLRGLRRDRLYVATVIGTLALTLGASTAVFSIVDGVLLKPLAYRESQRLVSVREVVRETSARHPSLPANAHHFDQWRHHATSFASMAALDFRTANLTGAGDPVQLSILRASGTLFTVLETQAAMGRTLTLDDEQPGRPAVAVISRRLWHERLGGGPDVIGRSLTLGGSPHTIVGVLPPGFELPDFDPLSGAGSLTGRVVLVNGVPVVRDGQVLAQFDVLLVLKNGILWHLECKTFTTHQKDLDARLFTLQRAGSQLARMAVCAPLLTHHVGEPWPPRHRIGVWPDRAGRGVGRRARRRW